MESGLDRWNGGLKIQPTLPFTQFSPQAGEEVKRTVISFLTDAFKLL